jgi:hypothetical protein
MGIGVDCEEAWGNFFGITKLFHFVLMVVVYLTDIFVKIGKTIS